MNTLLYRVFQPSYFKLIEKSKHVWNSNKQKFASSDNQPPSPKESNPTQSVPIIKKDNLQLYFNQKLNEEFQMIFGDKITSSSSSLSASSNSTTSSSSEKKNEQKQDSRDQSKETNLKIITRELINDSLQLPLKVIAYYTSGASMYDKVSKDIVHIVYYHNKQIEANKLISFFIYTPSTLVAYSFYTRVPVGPSKQYPYGMEQIKNVAVIVPSVLFIYCGGQVLIQAFSQLFLPTALHLEEEHNYTSMILYILSIGIETSVIFKNLKDADKAESNESEATQKQQSFIQLLKDVFQQKDPLLKAVLYENAITLTSSSIPLMCSGISIFFPHKLIQITGSTLIGIIQLYLGFHLGLQNVSSLVGQQGIQPTTLQHILEVIQINQFVKGIENEKAVMIGTHKFRFSCNITLNIDRLNEAIKDDYYQMTQQIVYTSSYQQRESILNEMISSVGKSVFQEIQKQLNSVESMIINHYPNCEHVDLEIQHDHMFQIMGEIESFRNFMSEGDVNYNEPTQVNQKWVIQQADRLIKLYDKVDKDSFKLDNKFSFNDSDYQQSKQHLNNQVDSNFIEEYLYLNEDRRFIIIHDALQELSNSKRQF